MRVGVLGNETSWYVEQLCASATSRGHEAFALQFPMLSAAAGTGVPEFWFADLDATTLDAVIVRTMPPGSLEQVVCRMDVLSGLQQCGVRVVNSPQAIECAVDKYLTTQRLSLAGVPVPQTVVCETAEAAMDAFDRLGRDVVVKPLFGAEGRGMVRVDQPELALRTFRTLERLGAVLYLQRFLTGSGEDIRLLMLDGRLISSMKRRPKDGDFRANAAQMGTSRPWQPTDHEVDLALQAAHVTGCVFSGVDLMYDSERQPFVIEVNAVPGWRAIQKTCDVNVCDEFFKWLESTA